MQGVRRTSRPAGQEASKNAATSSWGGASRQEGANRKSQDWDWDARGGLWRAGRRQGSCRPSVPATFSELAGRCRGRQGAWLHSSRRSASNPQSHLNLPATRNPPKTLAAIASIASHPDTNSSNAVRLPSKHPATYPRLQKPRLQCNWLTPACSGKICACSCGRREGGEEFLCDAHRLDNSIREKQAGIVVIGKYKCHSDGAVTLSTCTLTAGCEWYHLHSEGQTKQTLDREHLNRRGFVSSLMLSQHNFCLSGDRLKYMTIDITGTYWVYLASDIPCRKCEA